MVELAVIPCPGPLEKSRLPELAGTVASLPATIWRRARRGDWKRGEWGVPEVQNDTGVYINILNRLDLPALTWPSPDIRLEYHSLQEGEFLSHNSFYSDGFMIWLLSDPRCPAAILRKTPAGEIVISVSLRVHRNITEASFAAALSGRNLGMPARFEHQPLTIKDLQEEARKRARQAGLMSSKNQGVRIVMEDCCQLRQENTVIPTKRLRTKTNLSSTNLTLAAQKMKAL